MKLSFEEQRRRMVARHLRGRGVRDQRVLAAMGEVPRERFVPSGALDLAYEDAPLSIGYGQTISQPYVVAVMIEALAIEPNDRVLEVGAGSGYAAAILAQLAAEVFAVERFPSLARLAQARALDLGLDHVHVRSGDGTLGWPEHAPYDAILVSAGGPEAPQPLLDELAIGGRLVIPVGRSRSMQMLIRVHRLGFDEYEEQSFGPVHFVPLIGDEGW